MSYLGSWKIDDYLTFCCNTHDPDTGVATDADSVPTYRVYEDETGAAILNGVTAKLDDANTTGFYSERIQLTAVNGFEKGKTYTIYISATVDGDTGTMHHNFQMEAEVDCNTASGLHADFVDGGRLDLLIDAIKAVTDALPDAGALNDLAAILTDTNALPDNGALNDLATILTDTGELQTDWADGGRLDLLIDAIKAVTDALPDAGALNDLAAILTDTNALPDNGALNDLATILTDTGELQTDLQDGGRLDLLIDAIKAKTDNLPADPADDSDIDAQLATIAAYLDTEIAAILADTGELQTDWADGGRLDLILDAAGGAGDPWSTAIPGAYGAGTAGKILGDNINAPIATVDTIVDAIKAKTDNLPADPADDSDIDAQLATIAGYLDTEVAAIKTVTDALPDAGALNDLAAILADTGTDGVVISATEENAIADAILKRGVDNAEATADVDSLAAVILAMLHSAIAGTTWTLYRTDDVTVFDTKDVTVDAAADPVTGVADP